MALALSTGELASAIQAHPVTVSGHHPCVICPLSEALPLLLPYALGIFPSRDFVILGSLINLK